MMRSNEYIEDYLTIVVPFTLKNSFNVIFLDKTSHF